MLRKVVLCTAVLALTLAAPRAHAGSTMLSLFGGAHVPSGDYKDAVKTGFMGGVAGDYMLNDMWATGLDLSFNRAKFEDDGTTIGGATVDHTATIIQGGAHVKYLIPTQGQIVPFIEAGGGMYNLKNKGTAGTLTIDSSDTKVGGHGGVGVNFKANDKMMIGAAGNLHYINTEGTSTQYFDVHAGITFNLGTSAGQ